MKKVIILIGAPGSGKGTQANLLKSILNIAHISTGDLLREEISNKTPLGEQIGSWIASGKLVDDITITKLLSSRIEKSDCDNGFILDGYPRTANQARILSDLLDEYKISYIKVIEIVLDDSIIIKRILGRYTCDSCNHIYNEYFHPTKIDGVCDVCGCKSFTKRKDDNLETLEKRLKIYHEESTPILDFYQEKGIKFQIDGDGDIQESKDRLLKILN